MNTNADGIQQNIITAKSHVQMFSRVLGNPQYFVKIEIDASLLTQLWKAHIIPVLSRQITASSLIMDDVGMVKSVLIYMEMMILYTYSGKSSK